MTEELKQKLIFLANKYEISAFCNDDPSRFIRWYNPNKHGAVNVECCCFISAMLAFGSRKQFIPKIQYIMELADSWAKQNGAKGVSQWCLAGAPGFSTGAKKYYRFYSYDDIHTLFSEYAEIIETHGSLGEYLRRGNGAQAPQVSPSLQPALQSSATPSSGLKRRPQRPLTLADQISKAFPNSAIVPKGMNSANKRVHMFLRWMVRQNSTVDLGLWSWAEPSQLLIPLDVHVMQEGIKLGLLPQNAKATRKTAELLTKQMEQVFPGDPARADFALFGLGVDPAGKNQ